MTNISQKRLGVKNIDKGFSTKNNIKQNHDYYDDHLIPKVKIENIQIWNVFYRLNQK